MYSNVITAVFGASHTTRTRALWQWDYDMSLDFRGLRLPEYFTVHFANRPMSGTAKKQIGHAMGESGHYIVSIPDEYLTTGQPIYAWVYLHEGETDGETVCMVEIPVNTRPEPTEEPPTPVQQGLIEQAIAALNAGVEAAQDAAESVQDMGVEAETLAAGSEATVEKAVDPNTGTVTLSFGILAGTGANRGRREFRGSVVKRAVRGSKANRVLPDKMVCRQRQPLPRPQQARLSPLLTHMARPQRRLLTVRTAHRVRRVRRALRALMAFPRQSPSPISRAVIV